MMANIYRFTAQEMKELKKEWETDPTIEWDLKDFIQWHTRWTDSEFFNWVERGEIPPPLSNKGY